MNSNVLANISTDKMKGVSFPEGINLEMIAGWIQDWMRFLVKMRAVVCNT